MIRLADNIVLIFDEVMTGFRLAKGGASELYGVIPDMVTLGKIIGGGLPVGAFGGKKEIMDMVAPVGPVYQAGTLSGNPIAMSCGYTLLKELNELSNKEKAKLQQEISSTVEYNFNWFYSNEFENSLWDELQDTMNQW